MNKPKTAAQEDYYAANPRGEVTLSINTATTFIQKKEKGFQENSRSKQ